MPLRERAGGLTNPARCAGIKWEKLLDAKSHDDGAIHKWEMMDALDEIMNSRFLQIRNGLTDKKDLQKKLEKLEKKLAEA